MSGCSSSQSNRSGGGWVEAWEPHINPSWAASGPWDTNWIALIQKKIIFPIKEIYPVYHDWYYSR